MIGLLKKDIMLILKNLKPMYFIAILPPVLSSLSNPNYFVFIISITFAFIIAMQIPITLELDERVQWEKIVLSMPVDVRFIAISKYILTILLSVFAGGLVTVISSVYYGSVNMLYGVVSASMVMIYNMIVIPVSYRFGTEVSKYFLILFISIPVLAAYIFQMFHINLSAELMKLDAQIIYILLCIIVVGCISLSVYATIRTLNRRK